MCQYMLLELTFTCKRCQTLRATGTERFALVFGWRGGCAAGHDIQVGGKCPRKYENVVSFELIYEHHVFVKRRWVFPEFLES